eukprot:SAG11_NODE_24109_length_378_cov_0.637993_1_plen_22_part_10
MEPELRQNWDKTATKLGPETQK